jgi:tetratricopeptide (TPR) repeat protein
VRLLLDGFTTLVTQGCATAEPTLRRAVNAFLRDQVSEGEWLQWGILAQMAAMAVWDFDSWIALSTAHVERARASGALASLSIALNGRGMVATQCGDFEMATSLSAEKDVINEVTGIRLAATCDLFLAGYRGRPADAIPLLTATTDDAIARGEGLAVQMTERSVAVLYNGLGRYTEALRAAEQATEESYSPLSRQLTLPELIEAAVRTGRREQARGALDRLSSMTTIEGSDWAKGLEAGALASAAEHCYAQRSSGSAAPGCGPNSRGPTCCTASGCVARTDGSTRASSCAPPTSCSPRWARRPSPSVPGTSCRPRARGFRRREVDARTELTPQEEHIDLRKLGIASRKELDHALTSQVAAHRSRRKGRRTEHGRR